MQNDFFKKKNEKMVYHGDKMKVSQAIHKRMCYHWAMKEYMALKDFELYFKTYVFKNVKLDRPYVGNIDDWMIDCLIKRYFQNCVQGFIKTASLLGKKKFQAQIAVMYEEVLDKVAAGAMEGRHK